MTVCRKVCSQQQCTCAGFFQSDESEGEVELLLRDMTSLLAFLRLSFTAMRCRPFLLRCVDKFLWYFASFLSKEVIICSGVPFLTPLPYFTQMHSFACARLARSLREKCNFSVLDLLDWHILKPLLLDPYKMPNEQWLANSPNLKTFWSDLQIY